MTANFDPKTRATHTEPVEMHTLEVRPGRAVWRAPDAPSSSHGACSSNQPLDLPPPKRTIGQIIRGALPSMRGRPLAGTRGALHGSSMAEVNATLRAYIDGPHDDPAIAKQLIEEGATPTARFTVGDEELTLIELAAKNGKYKTFTALLSPSFESRQESEVEAVLTKLIANKKTADALIEAIVESFEKKSVKALKKLAVKHGSLGLLQRLQDQALAGSKPIRLARNLFGGRATFDMRFDDEGRGLLQYAVVEHHDDIVAFLLKCGVSTTPPKDGEAALAVAAKVGCSNQQERQQALKCLAAIYNRNVESLAAMYGRNVGKREELSYEVLKAVQAAKEPSLLKWLYSTKMYPKNNSQVLMDLLPVLEQDVYAWSRFLIHLENGTLPQGQVWQVSGDSGDYGITAKVNNLASASAKVENLRKIRNVIVRPFKIREAERAQESAYRALTNSVDKKIQELLG